MQTEKEKKNNFGNRSSDINSTLKMITAILRNKSFSVIIDNARVSI